jgi:hypothetical protein
MKRKITYIALVFIFGACLLPAVSAGQSLQGPVLDQAERGWTNFGLVFRAEADVLLVSVHYPNQGLADSIELRLHSDKTRLCTVPVPAGNPDVIVTINYPLKAGEIYEIVATTPNNRYWTYFSQWPVTNSEITVLSSYGKNSTYVAFWFAFDVITAGSIELPAQEITIDIKPGSDLNSINLKSKGVVTVAVLTTEEFDACTSLNPESVLFSGAPPVHYSGEDIDNDGDEDMVFQFRTESLTELDENSTEAFLTGVTYDDISVTGTDSVKIVAKKK